MKSSSLTTELGSASKEWRPVRRRPVPKHLLDPRLRNEKGRDIDELWTNYEYEVFVYYADHRGPSGALHLSIKRYDREPARDWRHLQSIKNEVTHPEREAMELFPAESRLVDQANQTHLFVMAAGVAIPLGWQERIVLTEEQGRAMVDLMGLDGSRGRQRRWQPGLSTGPDAR